MFERHIYNEDFFKFFKDVCNCLSLPDLNETLVNFIYTDHVNLSPEVKLTIRTLVSILSLLIFYILAKSDDNKVFFLFPYVLLKLDNFRALSHLKEFTFTCPRSSKLLL